jgi:RNA polymerase II elongation factor ELL
MAATLLPSGGIALYGAPDSDIGSKDAKHTPIQAMQLDLSQEIVDELLESLRSGKPPQLYFGRTPVCTPPPLSPLCCVVALPNIGRRSL